MTKTIKNALCILVIGLFTVMLAACGSAGQELLNNAKAKLDAGQASEAVQLYEQAVTATPEEAAGYLGLAKAWEAQGKPEKAFDALVQGLEKTSGGADVEQALAALEQAYGRAVAEQASVKLRVGDTAQLTVFTSALRQDKVTYESSNSAVAVVDEAGKVTAAEAGQAEITVGGGKTGAKVAVTVEAISPEVEIGEKAVAEAIRVELRKAEDEPIYESDLPKVRNLDISDMEVKDLSFISRLEKLSTLKAYWPQGMNLSVLGKLKGLQSIRLTMLSDGTPLDINPLSELSGLTDLFIFSATIEDLSPLTSLNNLTTLQLFRCTLSDLSPLSSMKGLKQLELVSPGSKGLTNDIMKTYQSNTLNSLRLDNQPIESLDFLSGFPNLTVFAFSNGNFSSLEGIEACKKLTAVLINGNTKLSDLGPLAKLTQLQILHINQVPNVTDISALAGLKNLVSVGYEGTPIKDLSPIEHLQQ